MEPLTTAAAAAALKTATKEASMKATTKAVGKLIENIEKSATGVVQARFKRWSTDSKIKGIAKKIASVRKVKTIWQFDKPIDLYKFYFPSKVNIDGSRQEIKSLTELSKRGKTVVVEGTVGQGKSMFLRHLCAREIYLSEVVPLFIELRYFDDGDMLRSHIFNALKAIGLTGDKETFEYLSESGRLAICLDGFDEVKSSARTELLREIQEVAAAHEKLLVVVTSRPDNGIDKLPIFQVIRLAPLEQPDVEGVIEKLTNDPAMSEEIRIAIDKRKRVIGDLLTTPLMVTLLVMSYKNEKEIPETVAEFYEALFNTLLVRHDKLKPTYRRPRKSKLSDEQIRILFDTICFLARKRQLAVIQQSELDKICRRAKEIAHIDCDSRAFVEDISRITCLLVEEGGSFHFIHKSVAEFHSSSYLTGVPEAQALKFYSAARGIHGRNWHPELDFLNKMDRFRFCKHYLIPELEAAIVSNSDSNEPFFKHLLNDMRPIVLQFNKNGELRLIINWERWQRSWAYTKLNQPLFRSLVQMPWGRLLPRLGRKITKESDQHASIGELTHEITLKDLFEARNIVERSHFLAAIRVAATSLKRTLTEAKEYVAATEASDQEFDDL